MHTTVSGTGPRIPLRKNKQQPRIFLCTGLRTLVDVVQTWVRDLSGRHGKVVHACPVLHTVKF